ncbi:hypothetical protein AB0N17_12500 [Streptomyces sp. NPDC051133]
MAFSSLALIQLERDAAHILFPQDCINQDVPPKAPHLPGKF